MAEVDYEKVVFSDYEEFDSQFENEKDKLKSDLEKQKKFEPKPVNYMILDPICTTFDPEDCLKQYQKFMESSGYNSIKYYQPNDIPKPPEPIQPKWFKELELHEDEWKKYSSYARILITRYNEVKGSNFEFVRLSKAMANLVCGVSYCLRFQAKPISADHEHTSATVTTFEGFMFEDLYYPDKVWPCSCRILKPMELMEDA